ncbi:hypothetical protein CBOM_07975 [Ceraceosorus bombacis]|uniref:Uncharacterized protein n=1 Tax=Ceraceosorus bombacis TaxID=401625 RepID=A0A0P1BRG8_9BASI|nr:hypothetical protein CBOM_07975 [Ceraceosorus bombacis]
MPMRDALAKVGGAAQTDELVSRWKGADARCSGQSVAPQPAHEMVGVKGMVVCNIETWVLRMWVFVYDDVMCSRFEEAWDASEQDDWSKVGFRCSRAAESPQASSSSKSGRECRGA